jgi:hypothetical protein
VALIEVVTCYFFPEGVDTSGEHWWSGFWCGVVALGGWAKILGPIKSVAVAA